MATSQISGGIQHLRRTVLLRDGAGLTDGQLLEDYISRRDQAALAALVRRHGPTVWGVCRRVLNNHHDAEDAFQATFLVLVRKANSIVPRELVANWLYGVASQTALKARATAAKRKGRERQVAEMPEPAVVEQDLRHDLQPLLDEELGRLPDKYRAVIILCDLEGKTRKEAARQLTVPEGSVAGWLARARAMLAKRLARRGVVLSGGALAALLSQNVVSAGVPTSVVSSTIKAASLSGAGQAAATGVVSAKVAALTEGVLKSMFPTKLKTSAMLLLMVALLGVAAGTSVGPALGQPPTDSKTAKTPAVNRSAEEKKPRPANPGKLLLARADAVTTLSPEGKKLAESSAPAETNLSGVAWLSPDGERAALLVIKKEENAESRSCQVVIRKLAADKPVVTIDVPAHEMALPTCWSPDGKKLVLVKRTGEGFDVAYENVLIDADTGKAEPLALPAATWVIDWSRTGNTFLVQEYDRKAKKCWLGLSARGDKEVTPLCELHMHPLDSTMGRFSPDGKQVLFTDADPENDKDADKWGVSCKPYLLDVATKKRTPLADFPLNARAFGVAWSPDGKRVAYTWTQLHADLLKKDEHLAGDDLIATEAFLVVADAEGKNAKTIDSAKASSAYGLIFGTIDWR